MTDNLSEAGVQNAADLNVARVFAVNEDFRFSIINQGHFGTSGAHFTVQLVGSVSNITVLIPNGEEASLFLSNLKQAITLYHKENSDGNSHDWLTVYKDHTMANSSQFYTDDFDPIKTSGSNEGDETIHKSASYQSFTNSDSWSTSSQNSKAMDAIDNSLKRSLENLADSVRQGEALTDREQKIRLVMKGREQEFTTQKPLRVFCGTWNVNGQLAKEKCAPWLMTDEEPPDIYAIGFQELDLSKNAYVFESSREGEWLTQIEDALQINGLYLKVRVVRLVAMMLVVYVKQQYRLAVTEDFASTVATGIMSVLGNKGGVGIGFRLYDTTICFVNSHFAAHLDEIERRNQDYQVISKTMKLGNRTINDHDVVFWLGDFNYRLNNIETDVCKLLLAENDLQQTLACDQLTDQWNQKKVFNDFVEAPITFQPTYKYDPGTDVWDSSDKARKPAWCDRVLWRGDGVVNMGYRSHPIMKLSDHKPVSALSSVQFKTIIPEKKRIVYEDVMKTLDRWENDWLPQVTLNTTEINFTDVRFLESQQRTVTITNTGKSPVEYEFIAKLNEQHFCKRWLDVKQHRRTLAVNETYEIQIEALVDSKSIGQLNSGEDDMNDILVLHLNGGKDLFISVTGNVIPTSFGMSVEKLVRMYESITEVPTGNLLDLGDATPSSNSVTSSVDGDLDVPKEIWRLVDHIYNHGMDQENLFQVQGLHSEMLLIRDCLDTGLPAVIPGNIHSIAGALMIFLESLSEPIIVRGIRETCIAAHSNFLLGKMTIMNQMPMCHQKLFSYICSFLRELLKHPQNRLDTRTLAVTFSTIFFGSPINSSRSAKEDRRMQISFLTQFLNNEFDCKQANSTQ